MGTDELLNHLFAFKTEQNGPVDSVTPYWSF